MLDREYIKLAEDETLSKFLVEQKQSVVDEISHRRPDGSEEYVQATLGSAARLYALQKISMDLADAADAARDHLKKKD
jgi:hypothetical protein